MVKKSRARIRVYSDLDYYVAILPQNKCIKKSKLFNNIFSISFLKQSLEKNQKRLYKRPKLTKIFG